uniref:Predicted protein n=1 Tax=Hordeum vulgare subsp. vulgare TaxID=112509 RepID=F2E8T9_HORVV|nr:predicted protein [Hordeum vulgare subsp. vulgare]
MFMEYTIFTVSSGAVWLAFTLARQMKAARTSKVVNLTPASAASRALSASTRASLTWKHSLASRSCPSPSLAAPYGPSPGMSSSSVARTASNGVTTRGGFLGPRSSRLSHTGSAAASGSRPRANRAAATRNLVDPEPSQSACATRIPSATPPHVNRVTWSASAAGPPSLSPGARRPSSGESGLSASTSATVSSVAARTRATASSPVPENTTLPSSRTMEPASCGKRPSAWANAA